MKTVYLLLAIIGAVVPYVFFFGFFIALNRTIGLSCALPAYLYAVTPARGSQPESAAA